MNDQSGDFASEAARMTEMTDIVIDQIRKLAALRDEGILTEEEFEHKKRDLLERF